MNKKVWIGVAIVVVLGLFVFVAVRNADGAGGKQVEAKYGRVVQGEVAASVLANGMVEEKDRLGVYLDVSVPVLQVLAEDGDMVSAGQPVVTFDLTDLEDEVARLENNLATSDLTLQKLRLLQDPKGTTSLEASETVARNNLASAEQALAEAEKRLASNKTLFAAGTLSQSELDQSTRAVDEARAARNNASANLTAARASLSDARKNNASSQTSTDLDIRIQELGRDATQTALEKAKKTLAEADAAMQAPASGVLTDSLLREGMYAGGPGQALYAVSDVSGLKVRAQVKEYDIGQVSLGQTVSFYGDAFSREEGVTGVVTRIGASAFKQQSGTGTENVVEVMMDVTQTVPVLRPGLGATCVIYTERREDVPVLPLEAIAENKDGDKYVFVLEEPGLTMKQTFIRLGIFSDNVVEVTEGLSAGQLVVLDPQPTFRDGLRAKGTEASADIMKGQPQGVR